MRKILIFMLVFCYAVTSWAQCAMCRTQIVNNVSAGDEKLASGINFGILYLFVAPYLLIAIIVLLWFRFSTVDERKNSIWSSTER